MIDLIFAVGVCAFMFGVVFTMLAYIVIDCLSCLRTKPRKRIDLVTAARMSGGIVEEV